MLGIIGLILKIILFIILAILGLLILIISIVLWVPFRYKLVGEKLEKLGARGSVSWLFGLIRVVVNYEDQLTYRVKVLFFTVMDSEKQVVHKEKKQRKDKNKTKTQSNTVSQKEKAVDEPTITLPKEEFIKKDPPSEEAILDESIQAEPQAYPKEDKEAVEEAPKQSTPTKEPTDAKPDKKKKKNKAQKKSKGTSKFKELIAAWEQFKAIWDDPAYQGVLKFVMGKIIKILKSILPKSIRGDLAFGTGDPATTGYIFGGICLFYGVTRDKFVVRPDFMEKTLLGRITIKGRVFLGVLVYYSIRIYLDKRVRKLIKVIRKNNGTN